MFDHILSIVDDKVHAPDPYYKCACGWVGYEIMLAAQWVDGWRLTYCPMIDKEENV